MIGESRGGARHLNYGAIDYGEIPGCGPKHPENCQHEQSNPYTRGCLPFERCRQPISGGHDEEYVDNEIVAHDDDMVQQPIEKASGPASGPQKAITASRSSTFLNYNRH
ncbi:hypothetical protein FNV43_RR14629 [Rhamnella rubrinervis]|uniref:Uncharacterized protein n=1 Tax=Rhamnella rubrinervis TaxID=2594499 RepID=A0A8K0MGE9_9ROSA|nr:hypothetical protein FNV43_RR14629 [Rhamnella rubrinervis]